jgi:uncharacterized membrane protein YedE/YeeE
MDMTFPLYEHGFFGEGTSLLIAVIIGFFFGLFLERAGLGSPHRLIGVFYLTDFTVPKVMFTAIVVAASGLYLLSDLGIMDMEKLWIVPTFFWPQIAGGLIFGIGYVLSGYCPGTSVAALASGRVDTLIAMAGVAAGSLVFAMTYNVIEPFYLSSGMDGLTLQKAAGTSHWLVIVFLWLAASAMFYVMERYERKRSG